MTEPEPELVGESDVVRAEEKSLRDDALAAELARTEKLADALEPDASTS